MYSQTKSCSAVFVAARHKHINTYTHTRTSNIWLLLCHKYLRLPLHRQLVYVQRHTIQCIHLFLSKLTTVYSFLSIIRMPYKFVIFPTFFLVFSLHDRLISFTPIQYLYFAVRCVQCSNQKSKTTWKQTLAFANVCTHIYRFCRGRALLQLSL